MSSTIMTSPIENESGSGSGGDNKKRSKLGYHRSAVACGHCRRRKIRCMPSTDPTETRCQNCIRLRRECQFSPVDQAGTNVRNSRSDSRTDLGSQDSDTVESSSSSVIPGSAIPEFNEGDIWSETPTDEWVGGNTVAPASAGSFEHESHLERQGWSAVSTHPQMPSQFQHHGTHPALNSGAYWAQSEETGTPQNRQQPYSIVTTSTPCQYSHDAQPVYQSPLYQDTRQSAARQSFGGLPTTHADHPFHNHDFPEAERRMTMPANIYNHAEDSTTNMQMDRQLTPAHPSYMYDQQFPLQYTQSPQSVHWFSPPILQQGFQQQYQSSQHNLTPNSQPNPG